MIFKPKNILVTGAAGFIGCNFVRMMLNKYNDIKIVSYDKLTYAGSIDNLQDVMDDSRHVFIQGDICDRQIVARTLRAYAIDTIVHFAAESHVDNSIAGPEVFFQTNVMGTLSLVDEARKYWQDDMNWNELQCRFHHVSTDEVYGTLGKDDPGFTEESPYAPNSPYSASKAGSDHIVRSYFHTYKLPVTMSNCSNNYGPYQHQEKLIPVIIQACIDQKPIPIYGDGSNIRDWLYVDDHCNAVDLIIRQGKIGETYNVGGDNELSNLELAKAICQQMDEVYQENKPHKKLITFVDDRKGHDWRYAIDNTKICSELNWSAVKNFFDGIKNTIYLSNIEVHSSNLKVDILVDNPTSWILPCVSKLICFLKSKGHDVVMHSGVEGMRKGDILFLLSCNEIVPKSILDRHKHNIVVHPSRLPEGRGFSPMAWQILEAKNEITVSLFEAVEEVDAGQIYFQEIINLAGHELNNEIKSLQGRVTIELCKRFVDSYPNPPHVIIDSNIEPSFYPRRSVESSKMCVNKSIVDQFNLMRVVDNDRYPLYFTKDGYKYILKVYKECMLE